MKTLQIVKRNINGIKIGQRSDNEYMCATDLVSAYNRNREITAPLKKLDNYLALNSTQELFEALNKRNPNTQKNGDLKNGLIITKRGQQGGTYIHPLVIIDLAMWLSVDLKIWALEVLNDHLIELRHIVGDDYKELMKALTDYTQNIKPKNYVDEANMINELIWGGTYKNKRNNATKEELALLRQLQKTDIQLLKEGKPFEERYRILKRFKQLL